MSGPAARSAGATAGCGSFLTPVRAFRGWFTARTSAISAGRWGNRCGTICSRPNRDNMIDLFKKRTPSSILGLTLDGNRLEAVVVRRLNGALQVKEKLTASLALSPLSGDTQLVGREIRNHLDQAGIRERHCALCIPPSFVLTLPTKLPDLPEADIESFLQIEAERRFTFVHQNLFIAHSRF